MLNRLYLCCDVVSDESESERVARLLKVIAKNKSRITRGVALTVDDFHDTLVARFELGQRNGICLRCGVVTDESESERDARRGRAIDMNQSLVERGVAPTVDQFQHALIAAFELGQECPTS